MDLIISPWLWMTVALGIGIPVVFMMTMRYLVYRTVGRSSIIQAFVDTPKVPTLPIASVRQLVPILLLLSVMGAGVSVILLRYVYGLGAVTHLSDQMPWGIWIGFDVMGGVALAAGGFVIAATAHIFGLKRFEPLVRPAVLTGLLGYLLVIGGLMGAGIWNIRRQKRQN